jgi:hypothetical protein
MTRFILETIWLSFKMAVTLCFIVIVMDLIALNAFGLENGIVDLFVK